MVRKHWLCIMPVGVGKKRKDEEQAERRGHGGRKEFERRFSSWQLCAHWEGFGFQQKLGYTQQLPGTCSQAPTSQMLACRRHQFNWVQSLSCVWLFVTPWTVACQTSLSIAISRSLLILLSVESVMPSNHLILCRPLLLPPSIFPSIRVFTKKVSSSHHLAKVLEFQLQHQSFQWIWMDFF